MKRLYIIRHAKSDWSEEGLSDFDRGLNKRGKRSLPLMGGYLVEERIMPQLILSSPAKRAKKTAQELAWYVGIESNKIRYDEELYEATLETLLEKVRLIPDRISCAFLVGHNPGLTELAEFVSGEQVGNIPTCGVLGIELYEEDWQSMGSKAAKIVSFEYPKRYAKAWEHEQ